MVRSRSHSGSIRIAAVIVLAALVYGLGVHALTVLVRDHGPTWDSLSLRGNGAIVVPLVLGVIGLIAATWFSVRQRAWPALVLAPVALIAGMVVVAGGF